MQQDLAKLSHDLREHMRQHHQSQSDIADNAKVDQATVSRFLKKPPQRVTVACRKLCNYAEIILGASGEEGQTAVRKALDECWNRSEAHATAISKIIVAFVELCRQDRDKEESSG